MALTPLQRDICRLIAGHRIASGESYVAGGVALNELLSAPRVSRDIDLFHDTEEALDATWRNDRKLLETSGFEVRLLRERPSFIEAHVSRGVDRVLMQWARDSAYRFFPLLEHPDFGLTLHPFDLATNKVLALVGRLEARDWLDVIECDHRLQPLGYLVWAACAKDPGFNPRSLLEHASRTTRYSQAELDNLAFIGPPPDAATLSETWHEVLKRAHAIVDALPYEQVGTCALTSKGELLREEEPGLREALRTGNVVFHRGRLRGALPVILAGG